MPPKKRDDAPPVLVYQTLEAEHMLSRLQERLVQAERDHYDQEIMLRLFEAQTGENKDEVVENQKKLVTQHAQAVLQLQSLIAEINAK